MAVVRVQNKTARQADGVGATASIVYDSTPTQGNLLIAVCSCRNGGSDGLAVTSSGWTEVNRRSYPSNGEVIMYGKLAGAGEPTTVTFSTNTGTPRFAMQALEYSGLVSTSFAACLDDSSANGTHYPGVCDLPDSDDELWVGTFYAQTNGALITDSGTHLTSVALVTTVDNLVANRVYELIPGASGSRLPADANVQMGGSAQASIIASFRQTAAGALPDTGTGSVASITLDHTASATSASAGSTTPNWSNNAEGAMLFVFIRLLASGGVPVTITTPAGWSVAGPITQPDADQMYLFYRLGAVAAFGPETFTFSASTAYLAVRGDYSGVDSFVTSATHGHQGGVGSGVTGDSRFWSGMTTLTTGNVLFLAGIGLRRTVSGAVITPTEGYTIQTDPSGNGNYIAVLDRTSSAGGFGETTVDAVDPGVGSAIAQMTSIIAAFAAPSVAGFVPYQIPLRMNAHVLPYDLRRGMASGR